VLQELVVYHTCLSLHWHTCTHTQTNSHTVNSCYLLLMLIPRTMFTVLSWWLRTVCQLFSSSGHCRTERSCHRPSDQAKSEVIET